jgi:hypothetical protein
VNDTRVLFSVMISLFKELKAFKALRSAIWFIFDACHRFEVDTYFLARSDDDIIETGWNLSLEKRM